MTNLFGYHLHDHKTVSQRVEQADSNASGVPTGTTQVCAGVSNTHTNNKDPSGTEQKPGAVS